MENLASTGIRSLDRPARSSVAIPTELAGPPASRCQYFLIRLQQRIDFSFLICTSESFSSTPVQFETRCNSFVLHISTTFVSNGVSFCLKKLSFLSVISTKRKLFPVYTKKPSACVCGGCMCVLVGVCVWWAFVFVCVVVVFDMCF